MSWGYRQAYARRQVCQRLSSVDLDLGNYYGQQLGSESFHRLSVSIGWVCTSVVELGVEISYLDISLEEAIPDQEPVDGSFAYGGFLHANLPTGSLATPYFGAGFSIFEGDLADLYVWDLELSAGVKIYPSRRFGLLAAVSYNRLSPEREVPPASGPRYSAGILFKF